MTDAPPAPRPDLETIRGWAGDQLDELGGGKVGRIVTAMVDERSGEPEWLLARMGRFGHHTLVPSRDAVAGVGRVWVPYTRDQIRAAPRIEPGEPLTVAVERALLEHYRVAVDAERATELGQRPLDAFSARRVR